MPKAKMGRPSIYSQGMVDAMCERLANGESLRSVCEDETMPCIATVRLWLRDPEKEDFLAQYTRARDEQADFYADQIIEIADTAEDANLARLRIDARKWKAARMAPRKYGDRVVNEHSGVDGGPVQFENIERVIVDGAKPKD